LVNGAARLTHVTYTEICNFAYQGAKVIHPRAVELAMQKNIPIRVRATGSKDEGTLVTSASRPLEERPAQDRILTGVTHSARVTQLKVRSDAGRSGFQKDAFQAMAAEGISLDFFNVTPSEVTFTVPLTHEDRAITRLHELGLTVEAVRNVAKVAAVGAGIHGVPGVMARIVMALTERGIEILQSADSNTTIWCLVHEKDVAEAVRAIHDQFDLHAQGGV
ncbi:ACT domain-containing protein, partial [Ferroacidibacillus organovorans]